VLVLAHVLGWSAVEIADQEGAKSDAVRQRLHRARRALRERLDLDDATHEETTDVR
jgi:DNA-directed RNA polymerase specialized sigma24 family protein